MNNIYSNYPDELYHYGVLGMKWGMHKAAMKGQEYNYKSMVTKHDEKKAAKLTAKSETARSTGNSKKAELLKAKSKIYEDRAEAGRKWDKQRENYARTADTGAAIARKLLLAPGLDRIYQNQRAQGKSVNNATKHVAALSALSLLAYAGTGAGLSWYDTTGANKRYAASARSKQEYKTMKRNL